MPHQLEQAFQIKRALSRVITKLSIKVWKKYEHFFSYFFNLSVSKFYLTYTFLYEHKILLRQYICIIHLKINVQILVETQKYLTCLGVLSKIYETDELLLYPNNKKMLRGIITSQLSTFVGVIFLYLMDPGSKPCYCSYIQSSLQEGRVVGISIHKNILEIKSLDFYILLNHKPLKIPPLHTNTNCLQKTADFYVKYCLNLSLHSICPAAMPPSTL